MNKVKALPDIVKSFLDKWSEKDHTRTGVALYYWPKVIGDQLKKKTEAVRVKNGILWVKTPDPSLAYNLTFFKNEIIKKYQRYLGDTIVRSVRIIVGEITPPFDDREIEEGEKRKTKSAITIPPQIYQEMGKIVDGELKDVFIKFYLRHETLKK